MQKLKKEGFDYQRLIVLPSSIKVQLSADPFIRQLYLTDIGIFPNAENHLVNRRQGTPEYIIQFCFDGEGFCEFNGKKRHITAGNYFILPPEKQHSYGSYGKGGWKIGWMHLLGNGIETFINRLKNNEFGKPIQFKVSDYWLDIFTNMINSLQEDLSYANVAYNCSFVWPLLTEMIFHDRINSISPNDPIENVITLMKQNTDHHLSLNEMAEAANLSISRFSVVFKQTIGKSPNEYFLEMKMHKACNYLITTNKTVKEIAQKLGFDDPYYFSRCFKKRMGDSPMIYRQKSSH